jgi:DNA-binding MarR family transcriptional regulator
VDPLFEFALSVKAIDRELGRRINEAMRSLGITAAQADAVAVIGQAEPLSLKELGDLLIAEGGHPSRLVDRLVEAGLVERRPAEDDRRRIVLSLTPAGRRLDKKVAASREAIAKLGSELISPSELERTLKLFRRLLQATPYADVVERRRRLDRA